MFLRKIPLLRDAEKKSVLLRLKSSLDSSILQTKNIDGARQIYADILEKAGVTSQDGEDLVTKR